MVCGTGTGQEDKWTTSQAVVAQGEDWEDRKNTIAYVYSWIPQDQS